MDNIKQLTENVEAADTEIALLDSILAEGSGAVFVTTASGLQYTPNGSKFDDLISTLTTWKTEVETDIQAQRDELASFDSQVSTLPTE